MFCNTVIGIVFLSLPSFSIAGDLLATLRSIPEISNFASLLQPFADSYASIANITILAPSNNAITAYRASSEGKFMLSSTVSTQALLNYHTINGTYKNITQSDFLPTLLTQTEFTSLTSGQFVEVNVEEGNPWFLSGILQNASVITNSTPFDNGGYVYVIDNVLTLPQNFSRSCIAINMTSAVGAFEKTQALPTVDTAADLTILVPNNEAFKRIGGNLAQMSASDLKKLLQYHIIPDNVLYSSWIEGEQSITSSTGQNVTFRVIDGTLYINNARVLVPDVLLRNGVAHVIDAALNPANASLLPSTAGNLDAFSEPIAASSVPFTSGVPTPTSILPYEATATTDAGSDTDTVGKPRPPVAAIAGGVVGGVLGLAAVAGLVWWLMRRKGYMVRLEKKKKGVITGAGDRRDSDKSGPEDGLLYRKPELDSVQAQAPLSKAAEVIEVHELEPPPKPPVELDVGKEKSTNHAVELAVPSREVRRSQLAELE